MKKITWLQLIVRMSITHLVIGAMMFGVAGTPKWWEAWAYLIATGALSFWGRAVVMRRNPSLLAERAQSFGNEGVKPWDRVLMPLVAIALPIALILVAAVDVRFSWTPDIPYWSKIVALIAISAGGVVASRAFIHNAFFSGTVRIQTDRNHSVISSGPYAHVRHPGYAGGLLAHILSPILLGSLWAIIPSVALCVLLVVRTALEDRTLRVELPGYAAYAESVRYRLFPGIW